ncbi:MAG: accessory gene regulator B family protein [Oscillospiraceae bacterium]|nr:accessory gene regulator B family protein [Oscillospiraceae bacterium]
MVQALSRKLTDYLVTNERITEDQRELYEYGFIAFLEIASSTLAMIIIALVSGRIIESAGFLLGLIPIRNTAGGVHAKSFLVCFMSSVLIFILSLAVIDLTPEAWRLWVGAAACILSVILVFALAPIPNENKPLTQNELKRFKKMARVIILLISAAFISMVFFKGLNLAAYSLSIGSCVAALTLPFARININKNQTKNQTEKKEI